jgi:hypothetical protein
MVSYSEIADTEDLIIRPTVALIVNISSSYTQPTFKSQVSSGFPKNCVYQFLSLEEKTASCNYKAVGRSGEPIGCIGMI